MWKESWFCQTQSKKPEEMTAGGFQYFYNFKIKNKIDLERSQVAGTEEGTLACTHLGWDPPLAL